MTRPLAVQKLVVVLRTSVPLPIGDFEDGVQSIRERFIRSEDAKVALLAIQLDDVAKELAQHVRIRGFHRTRRRHIDGAFPEVRHDQVFQQQSAVCIRIRSHPTLTDRC